MSPGAVVRDITRLPNATTSHDCGSLSRVVMVRKTDQRLINHVGPKKDPQCELITLETIQTYRGHKPERTVVIKKSRDLSNSEMRSSLSPCRSLLNSTSSEKDTRSLLTNGTDEIDGSFDMTDSNANSNDKNNNENSPAVLNKMQQRASVRESSVSFATSTESLVERLKSSERFSNRKSKSPSPIVRRCTSAGTGFTDFEIDCLKAHNEYRSKHGVPSLKLNKRLCRYAEEWARVIAARGVLAHRSNSEYGENIFCVWSSSVLATGVVSGREPVDNWYSEVDKHVFGKEPSTLKTGHFTQVVWKDSRELGVGVGSNRSGQTYVVCNYDPPGNFIGSFSENVPPIGGFPIPKIVIDKSYDSDTPDDFTDFAKAMLRHHNEFRKRHGAHELKLNKILTKDAQHWAEILARDDRFTYRQNSAYGENLYCLWSSDRNAKVSPKEICRSWYDEVKEYNFDTEPRGVLKAGQFTQLVWKASKDLGIGMAKTKKGKVLVVATYYPRGNIIGQFMLNVGRGRF
ncbi:uncharacterized protein LOC134830072 isoform X2 [Culicoides brevitarsis]|uniref:uncharacterized protein LOC134830072 isoform X2 n=1 Tax=Culicoides brevitarsis TaxID=469753 RepID=UPI00307BC1A2